MIARSLSAAALLLTLLGAGCHKAAVESYRIPKEQDAELPLAGGAAAGATAQPASGGNAMANTAVPTATGADLTWTAPSAWQQKPGSAMRKGSYAVPGQGAADGDLSITAFPGDVGGELANVNRWRGQVQLPPVTDADLATQVVRVEHNGLPFGIVDVVSQGDHPTRILGAMVPYRGATWFFKLQGPDAVVAKAKPDFLNFLATVKPAAQ